MSKSEVYDRITELEAALAATNTVTSVGETDDLKRLRQVTLTEILALTLDGLPVRVITSSSKSKSPSPSINPDTEQDLRLEIDSLRRMCVQQQSRISQLEKSVTSLIQPVKESTPTVSPSKLMSSIDSSLSYLRNRIVESKRHAEEHQQQPLQVNSNNNILFASPNHAQRSPSPTKKSIASNRISTVQRPARGSPPVRKSPSPSRRSPATRDWGASSDLASRSSDRLALLRSKYTKGR